MQVDAGVIALLAIGAVLGLAVFGAWRVARGPLGHRGVRATPDRPRAFGYKCTWAVVPAETSDELVEALRACEPRFRRATPCNWEDGIERAYRPLSSRDVFVTPPIEGWVLIAGYRPTGKGEDVDSLRGLQKLSERLGRRVLFFGSQRGVGYVQWAIIERGEIRRAYCFADGTTYHDVGEPPPEELALDLVYGLAGEDADADLDDAHYDRMPDESTVLHLAGTLSVDPTQLEAIEEESRGVLVRLG